jgi:uncharacterized membrane protein YeaQ/YmgE (transglycosylase-associated protein family)
MHFSSVIWPLATRHILAMNSLRILWTLIIGGLAGWLAGQITLRRGFGVVRNILIGIIGSFLGGLLFHLLGLTAGGLIGSLVMSTVGALLLIYVINGIARK